MTSPSPIPGGFQTLSGGTVLASSATLPIALPFDFVFYGRTVREVALSRYGYLVVGATHQDISTNPGLPHSAPSLPATFIAPWWDTLSITATTRFGFVVNGVAPQRSVTFEYRDVGAQSTTTRVSMQVTLFESTGVIRLSYGPTVPGTTSASVGIQRRLGDGVAGLSCASNGACTSASWPASQFIDFVPTFQTPAACGASSLACVQCAPNHTCDQGQCVPVPCNFLTCQGCCLAGTCYPTTGQSAAVCGVNGLQCDSCPSGAICSQGACFGGTACDERTCLDGCCSNGVCVRGTSASAMACGVAGSACRACVAGWSCQGGQCVPPSPCLVVSDDLVDFGNVAPGCSARTRTIRLTNTCFTNAQISSIAFSAPNADFTLGSLPTLPLTLGLGFSASFTIRYHPTTLGPDTAAVTITSNSASPTIALRGVGGSGVNVMPVDVARKVDVLAVIDSSCSMFDKQAGIASNAAALFGFAFDAGVDFHFGVTTADQFDDGQLADAGTTAFLTPRSVPFVQRFANVVTVGTFGDSIEAGLETSVLALRPRNSNPVPNPSFLRHDANLAVWFVSDAPDQSLWPTSYYLELLQRIKAAPNRFSAHGLLATLPTAPTGCVYDGPADPTRYGAVITPTVGVLDEICSANFADALRTVGPPLFGLRQTWFLETAVDPAVPVSVTLDGVNVPSGAQTWTWDPVQNAVQFTRAAAPLPGQALLITSTAACLP